MKSSPNKDSCQMRVSMDSSAWFYLLKILARGHVALDCNDFHLRPSSRFPPLLDLAWISLPASVRRSKGTKFIRSENLGGWVQEVSWFASFTHCHGVHQFKVACVFLTVVGLRITWEGVICQSCMVQVIGSCNHKCKEKLS